MKRKPSHRSFIAAPKALGFGRGSLEWDWRRLRRCVTATAMALFSAEYRASQIVSGREQEIELTLTTHYRLPANPKTAVSVAYRVQVNAPLGWRVTPNQWAFSHTLKTSEIGFNETRNLALSVPVGAAQGQHSLQLVISPESGPAQSVNLVLTVFSPGA
jgi:hypothetical protein